MLSLKVLVSLTDELHYLSNFKAFNMIISLTIRKLISKSCETWSVSPVIDENFKETFDAISKEIIQTFSEKKSKDVCEEISERIVKRILNKFLKKLQCRRQMSKKIEIKKEKN